MTGGPWPARNPEQNIADLKAQVAACERGATELKRVITHYGLDVVHAYMGHVMENAEESVRRVIAALTDCEFIGEMDDGHQIAVSIQVNLQERSAIIDFSGTSGQHPGNFNGQVNFQVPRARPGQLARVRSYRGGLFSALLRIRKSASGGGHLIN